MSLNPFKFWAAWESYQESKEEAEKNKLWDAYDFDVTVKTLKGISDSYVRERVTLNDASLSSGEKADRLRERARTGRAGAKLAREHSREAWDDGLRTTYARAELARARLGTAAAQIDREGAAIAGAKGVLAAQRAQLARETGARSRQLDAMMSRMTVERRVFRADAAAKERVYRKMGHQIRIERGALQQNTEAQLRTLVARTVNLQAQEHELGLTVALAQAEIREDAAIEAGAVAATSAARVGGGSFVRTQRTRVQRERDRRLVSLEARERTQRTGLAAEYERAAEGRVRVLTGRDVEAGRLGVRAEELRAGQTALAGRRETFAAGQREERLGIELARAQNLSRLEVEGARHAAQAEDLRHRGLAAVAAREENLAGYELADAEMKAGANAAERAGMAGEQRYVELLGEAVELEGQALVEDRRQGALGREIADIDYSISVAEWQRKAYPELPRRGGGPSSMAFWLTAAAAVVD